MNFQNPAASFIAQNNKKVVIDGCCIDSLSGETFEPFNSATGEVLARVAKCGAGDFDAAVSGVAPEVDADNRARAIIADVRRKAA